MFRNPELITALILLSIVAIWGIVDATKGGKSESVANRLSGLRAGFCCAETCTVQRPIRDHDRT